MVASMYFCKKLIMYMFFKWPIPGRIFFIFVLSIQMFYLKDSGRLDSFSGPLVSEANALPTEPQPLPKKKLIKYSVNYLKAKCKGVLTKIISREDLIPKSTM